MSASIRSHLTLLVVALAAPMAALMAYNLYTEVQEETLRSKASLRTLATILATSAERKIATARVSMEWLAKRPLVMAVDPAHCDPALQDVHALNPEFANVAYSDMQGRVVCSAVPQPGGKPADVSQANWYQTVLKTQHFSVGKPFVGPITQKWVSVISTPIRNERLEMVGAINFPLDLSAFDPGIPKDSLPSGSRYGYFDRDGIMVWRNEDPEKVIGTRPNADAARRIVEVGDGEFESLAIDGVVRHFSVVRLPQAGWVAFVGVPIDTVYAKARARTLVGAGVGSLVLLILVGLALAVARRIERPLQALAATARTMGQGDLSVRARVSGPSEIVALAHEFNAMVQSRQEEQTQLQHMAHHDILTGLPNRVLLADRLQQAILQCQRRNQLVAVAFLDLDGFKAVNDLHGHDVGDQLLIALAQRMKLVLRDGDTLSRIGGDEFVAVLADLAQAQDSEPVLVRLLQAAAEPVTLGSKTLQVSASIGVTVFPQDGNDADLLIRRADQAMYNAKQAGRNRFFRFQATGPIG